MDQSAELRRMCAQVKWDITLMLARAFRGREEGRVFDDELTRQNREERAELLRRVAELDQRDRGP
jgi:hypothetical protein